MLWRKRAAPFARPLLRYPFAVAALTVYIAESYFLSLWGDCSLAFAFILALIGTFAYVRMPRPPEGRRARRRLIEGAFAFLLSVFLFGELPGLTWARFLVFPLFLVFVYAGYRKRELALLFGIHWALVAWSWWEGLGRGDEVLWVQGMLGLWILFALAFRFRETRKVRGLSDRLQLYEQEATALEGGSREIESILRMDEKKKAHLASMIRDREDSFRNLLTILQKSFDPRTCALYLYDAVEEVFLLKEHFTTAKNFGERKIQRLEGIFRAVLREQTPLRLISPTGELRGLTYYDGLAEVCAVIAIPLRSDDVLKGVVILDRVDPLPFAEDETSMIEQVADQLAKAIDNAEALHAYFHLKEEFANFYAASSGLNRSLRVEDVVETMLDSSYQIAKYDWGVVILYDEESGSNHLVAERGKDRYGWTGKRFACAPQRGLVSWVIKNQTPLSYQHYRRRQGKTGLFPRQLRLPNIYESALIVPLRLKGESLGAILLVARNNHAFAQSVRKMVEVIALHASASLKNAQMVGELELLATTDGLTHLVNHRTFQESLRDEIERAGRHPASISLLLVDIDFFKKFNDEFGHPIGDYVLREIATFLKRTVRKVDIVSRYGGEEFAIVLVNTDGRGAMNMAERIVEEVARTRFQYQGLTLRVTLSIGVATYPEDATSREHLLEKADRALYESKHQGRNRATQYRPALGKMAQEAAETRLIAEAEDELRRMVDQRSQPV